MDVRFTDAAYKDFLFWEKNDPKKVERIRKLCGDIEKKPFEGIGKPEPLKFDASTPLSMTQRWSRRIDKTHRLVYTVDVKGILVLACRYHY